MNTLSFFNPRFTSDLFDVIDRNFCDFDTPARSITPRVDVSETKDSYVLEMDLPGKTEKDVAIDLKDRVLTISSEKVEKDAKAEKKDEDAGKYLIKERIATQFSRSFTLPEDIDTEGLTAKFQNGLLTITIPRKAESKVRRIAITAE